MSSQDADERDELLAVLVETLRAPGSSARLPYLVGLLDAEDRFTRLCAAWACAAVAVEADDPGTTEYLVRRLSDRLDDASLELTTALDYISNCRPEQVETLLAASSGSDPTALPEVGSFTRSHYYGADLDRSEVGRTRSAGGGNPRPLQDDEGGTDSDDGGRGGAADAAEEESGEADGPQARQRAAVSEITARSRFDELHILAARERGRYADAYNALVGTDGAEQVVSLRLLRQPEESGEARRDYRRRVRARLRRWAAVDDHPQVVAVHDWGFTTRPWLATTLTGDPLSERGRRPTDRALADAATVADAVSHLHRNGVVHGGLDPGTVRYPEGGGEILLDDVGLVHAFRFHFEPAVCLDPRYAAPEYFDDRYGGIDHATDVYGAGAVLYRLLTGKAPYTGSFDTVRTAVLDREPPLPSEVADVPAAADEIVSKAMATEKLTRYETVELMASELASLSEASDG